MTQLTEKQIQQIEQFLMEHYDIKYAETRYEVLDHIACEIEELMTNGISYTEAFKTTFNKWNKNLSPHLWVRYNNIPRYLAKTWFWKDIAYNTLAIIIGLGIPHLFAQEITNNNLANSLFTVSALLSIALSIILYFQYRKIENYRLRFIAKEALGFGGIALFLLLMFGTKDISYKILPIILIIALNQSYYFIEAKKVKVPAIA